MFLFVLPSVALTLKRKKRKFQISLLDTSILVCTTLALTSFFFSRSQHQGTRITSGTASVVEVIWFPDVGFAESCCLSFVLFVPLVLFDVEWSVCKLLLCKLSLKLSLSHFC